MPGSNLGSPYTTATSYDALGRVTSQTSINLTTVTKTYNLRGLLVSVVVGRTGQSSSTVVSSISYNAKGQRTGISYGNTTSSTLTYDSPTFRLVRQQTVRSGDSAVLQDLKLTYDPVGNVVHVHDDGIGPSYFDNQQQPPDWDHTYDPLYRLVTATGREAAINSQDPVPSWVTSGTGFGPTPPPSGTAARNYQQQIAYDAVGNLSQVQHFVPGDSSASWTRSYSYASDSSRLGSDTIGGTTASYTYDNARNTSSMPHLPGAARHARRDPETSDGIQSRPFCRVRHRHGSLARDGKPSWRVAARSWIRASLRLRMGLVRGTELARGDEELTNTEFKDFLGCVGGAVLGLASAFVMLRYGERFQDWARRTDEPVFNFEHAARDMSKVEFRRFTQLMSLATTVFALVFVWEAVAIICGWPH